MYKKTHWDEWRRKVIVTGRRREEGKKDEEKGKEERGEQGRTLGDANTVIVPKREYDHADTIMYCKIFYLQRFQVPVVGYDLFTTWLTQHTSLSITVIRNRLTPSWKPCIDSVIKRQNSWCGSFLPHTSLCCDFTSWLMRYPHYQLILPTQISSQKHIYIFQYCYSGKTIHCCLYALLLWYLERLRVGFFSPYLTRLVLLVNFSLTLKKKLTTWHACVTLLKQPER